MADWTWDPAKEAANRRKHGLGFDLAQRVADDPLALSRLDEAADEQRWQTVGVIGGVAIFVVHTLPHQDVPGRLISARKATPHERRAYEEGDF